MDAELDARLAFHWSPYMPPFAANNTTSNDSNFTPEVEEPNATKVYTLTNRTVLTVHSKITPFDAQTLPLPRSRVRSGKRNKHASKTGNRW